MKNPSVRRRWFVGTIAVISLAIVIGLSVSYSAFSTRLWYQSGYAFDGGYYVSVRDDDSDGKGGLYKLHDQLKLTMETRVGPPATNMCSSSDGTILACNVAHLDDDRLHVLIGDKGFHGTLQSAPYFRLSQNGEYLATLYKENDEIIISGFSINPSPRVISEDSIESGVTLQWSETQPNNELANTYAQCTILDVTDDGYTLYSTHPETLFLDNWKKGGNTEIDVTSVVTLRSPTGEVMLETEVPGFMPVFGRYLPETKRIVIGFFADTHMQKGFIVLLSADGTMLQQLDVDGTLVGGGVLGSQDIVATAWTKATPYAKAKTSIYQFVGTDTLSEAVWSREVSRDYINPKFADEPYVPSTNSYLKVSPAGNYFGIISGHQTATFTLYDTIGTKLWSKSTQLPAGTNIANDGGVWLGNRYYRK